MPYFVAAGLGRCTCRCRGTSCRYPSLPSCKAPARPPSLPMPDPAAIKEAAERLARAKRPLIFLGGGAVGTRKPLTEIAERLGAPVLASNAGKGILPSSHTLSLGCSVLQEASRQALADADVVLLGGSEG